MSPAFAEGRPVTDPELATDRPELERRRSLDDTEAFPGNWVCLAGDYGNDGIWSGAGLFCTVGDLPVSIALQKAIEAWAFNYAGRGPADANFSEPHGRWFDTTGFELARRVSAALPHWTVAFSSEFGVYKTPSGRSFGIVTTDGTFADLTIEQEAVRKALVDAERGV